MSKRRSDAQLTKDDYEKQDFSYQNDRDSRPEEAVDPTKMADSSIMSGRKIAPLKRGRGGRGGPAGSSSKGGSTLPNFFAATPTGGFGTNGASRADGFSGFGTPQSAAPLTPTFGAGAAGGFNFGGNSSAPEPPKPFASLAPSNTNGGFGTPPLGGLFGASTPQSPSTGIFGNNSSASPAPVSTGFAFGGNSTVAPAQPAATSFNKAPTFNFGGSTAATPMFGSSDNKPAVPSTNTFTFGGNNGTPAVVTPPATSSFTFNSSAATTGGPSTNYFGGFTSEKTPEPQATPAAAPAPTFTFGAATPNTGTTPSASLFGKPSDSQGKSLFAKPADQPGSSLFGRPSHSPEPTSSGFKPSPSPEPSNNLFGSPAPTPTATSFFGQPKEKEQSKPIFGGFGDNAPATPKQDPSKQDPPKPLFGFSADSNTQQEPPKTPFGGFGDNKNEPPKSPFFSSFGTPAEKKDEPSKPLFGFGPPSTETKPETPKAQTPLFGAPSTPSVEINDDIMADNSPPKSPSVFNQPVNSPSPFTGFGSPKLAAAPPKESTPPPAMFAPTTTAAASTPTTSTVDSATTFATNFRAPSPPLPSDATSWTTAQLNEYYNLWSLRALNHSFLEGLKKADQLGDWSASCETYIRESKKIKECQQNGERYKGATIESKSGSNVTTSKRGNAFDDEVQGGGGKRSKSNGEDSKSSGSDSSKALASILGGSTSTPSSDPFKLATKPTYGFAPPSASAPSTPAGVKLASAPLFSFKPPAPVTEKKDEERGKDDESKTASAVMSPASSVFDSPNSTQNNSSFVNPFSSHIPDASEKDVGDDDDDTPAAPSPSGGLFGRITEPKKESTGSIFSSTKPASDGGLFSGKFGETNGTNGTSLFGSKPDAPKGLFGSNTSSTAASPSASGGSSLFGTPGVKESGFSFTGSNGANTPSAPASGTVTPTEDNSEPNDNAHLAKNEVDLSQKGPGEEDEDSLFEVRAIVYELLADKGPKKIGVGQLRVLKNRVTGKARVLARTEVGKVVLNVGLVKGVVYAPPDGEKQISVVEFLPDGGRKRYAIRVKLENAKNLGEAMDTAKLSS